MWLQTDVIDAGREVVEEMLAVSHSVMVRSSPQQGEHVVSVMSSHKFW